MKATYNPDGGVQIVQRGTVNGITDPDWAAMTVLETQNIAYDSAARPVTASIAGSDGIVRALTQQSYDSEGRLDCVATRMNPAIYGSLPASACTLGTAGSDGPDRVTKTVYDAASQVTQQQVAVGTTDAANEATFTYTFNGRLATLKDAENNLTTYVYDGFDRLSQTQYPSTPKGSGTSNPTDNEVLTYDEAGNLTNRQLRDDTNIAYVYDNLNRVTDKNLPGGEPDVTYAYDNLGRLISAIQTGNSLSFSYDALSRNLTQVGPQGTVTSEWDIAGRRTKLTYPGSGLYLDYDYLVTGEATRIRENGATSGIGVLATFAYDDLGRRTSLTFGNGASQAYTFDPVSRLASLTSNLTGSSNDLSQTFAYNPASQIVSQVRSNDQFAWKGHGSGSTASVANGLNQLASVSGVATAHDLRGNLITDPVNIKTYTYSSENLLLTSSGGISITLGYDPLMRLHQHTAGASVARFAYDGLEMIAEFDGSNILQRRYVHGPGVDEPLVQYEGSGTANRRFMHADERGSIVAISDGAGNLITGNRYDEYGKPAATNGGAFQYTGQMWLGGLGLYYYKARMYAPHLGRFMQTDPIGYAGGLNLYAYVRNDPINWTDPLGLTGDEDDGPIIEVCASGHWVNGKCSNRPDVGGGGVIIVDGGDLPLIGGPGGLGGPFVPVIICPAVTATVTGVGPNQAASDNPTAISGVPGRDIPVGNVAIDPLDFGVPNARGAARSILGDVWIFPIWSGAARPSNGAPARPRGLPSEGPYIVADVIGPASARGKPGFQIDLYRHSNHSEAFASTREVPVVVVIPQNDAGVTCPSGN